MKNMEQKRRNARDAKDYLDDISKYLETLDNVPEDIKNIFDEGELDKKVVVANYATTTQHGAIEGKTQSRDVAHYNLDMILSLG